MRHWHTKEEVELALGLYAKGATAKEAAEAVDPGSSKVWVLRAARKRGVSRSQPATRKMRNPTFGKYMRDGYVILNMPEHRLADAQGRVREHFVVWEQDHPDDPIYHGDIIHHINGIKFDNRPENLQKMTRAEHRKLKPRSKWKQGRGLTARVGEELAEELGIKLDPVDIGCDGTLRDKSVEIKTARAKQFNSWAFSLNKEADLYLLVALSPERLPVAVWLIPTTELGRRKRLSLCPGEVRVRGVDPYRQYRVPPEKYS